MGSEFYPVTHLIYDMDGLLIDSEPLYFKGIDQVCRKYGSQYTVKAKIKSMGRTSREGAAIVIEECNLPITVDEYLSELDKLVETFRGVPYLPGAMQQIKHFYSHNIPQALATSSKKYSFDVKMEGKEEMLKLLNPILLASDDPEVKSGKPSPDTFLIAAKRFISPPTDMKNVLVFEDSPNGVMAALNAGMQVVWIPEECVAKSENLKMGKPTLVLKSLKEFKPELFGLPGF